MTKLIEIMSRDNLRERLSLQSGDEVEVTFFEQERKKRNSPGLGIVRKIYGRETQLMKS